MAERSTHLRTCPLCEAMCGLEVHHAGGELTLIRGNRNDVWSRGYLCAKGTTLGALHTDPDRVRAPLARDRTGGFAEVGWEEAFERCWELIDGVRSVHGSDAIAAYFGNPVVHNISLNRYVPVMVGMSGLRSVYSAGTVDQWPKNVVCELLYGHAWRIPVPDIDRTDFMVLQGANPHTSQGSLMAHAGVPAALDAIRRRGRVVVIDPRRTGTVASAGEWLPIRPGTDALLQLAVVNVLFADGLVRLGHLVDRLDGVTEVRRIAGEFPPERVAATCGTSARAIRSLAREFAAAERAVWYGRIGTCTQEFGTLASWLPDVICALTANLDSVGGLMWPKPVGWSAMQQPWGPQGFGRWSSRVRGAPEVLGQFPASCLAEEIDTPGAGQIKALVVVAGNPVLSVPDSGRLDAALPLLEAMISVDNAVNETSRHADVILPGLSALEQPHCDDLLWTLATRSVAKWSPPLFPPAADRPEEWEILLRLSSMLTGTPAGSIDVTELDDLCFSALAEMGGVDPAVALAASPEPGPERLCDLVIRTGPWGDRYGENPAGLTLETVKRSPDGLDMGPMVPRIDDVVLHADGRVNLAPAYVTADVDRLRRRLERPAEPLVLVSRRQLRSNNSWMHNVPALVSGKDRCTLLIHPRDAEAAGVADGAAACIRSSNGEIEVPVEVSDEMMPGVVSLPHGWGHDKAGARQSVARRHPGANSNLLAPAHLVDVPSGNAVLNGIPVEVAPA